MASRRFRLTKKKLELAFDGPDGDRFGPVLSTRRLVELFGLQSTKTIYFWIASGHLDGTFRKRGKHYFFWRDAVLDVLFNGPEWEGSKEDDATDKTD